MGKVEFKYFSSSVHAEFDILNCALMNAEKAVKIMKQKEKDKQEGEMMKALEGVTVSGQVAPDSADGNFSVCVFSLIIIENNGCVPLLPILYHIRSRI